MRAPPASARAWDEQLPLLVRPWVVHGAVVIAGVILAFTPLLTGLKLDGWAHLEWWAVLLPVAVVLLGVFLVFTIAGLLWIFNAWRLLTSPQHSERGVGLNLDVLLSTAKICLLGHGYVGLLIVAFGLLLAKLYYWPDLSAVYVLLPLIILGSFYIFVAVMFKQPEVDVGMSFFIGIVLLSQCVMLSIKLDHFRTSSASFPWAITFSPSWMAYFLVLVNCGFRCFACAKHIRGGTSADLERSGSYAISSPSATSSPKRADVRTASSHDGGTGGDCGGGGAEPDAEPFRREQDWRQLLRLAAVAAWALGFGASQAMLSLRLDGLPPKASWLVVVSPGLAGWLLLLAFAADTLSTPSARAARLVYDPQLVLTPRGDAGDWHDEKEPLLPWR